MDQGFVLWPSWAGAATMTGGWRCPGGTGVHRELGSWGKSFVLLRSWRRHCLAPRILARWYHLGFLVFKIGIMPSAIHTFRLFREFFFLKKLVVVKTPVT